MPAKKIPKAASIEDVVDRLLELSQETEALAKSAQPPEKDKPPKIDSKELEKQLGELAGELAQTGDRINVLGKNAKEAFLCRDLARDCWARLLEIKKLRQLKVALDAAELPAAFDNPQLMAELIAAYRLDTRKNRVWGGDMEAHLGATVLRFRCKIFTEVNNQFKYVSTVGDAGDAMSDWHLLHSGNHYEVIKADIVDGRAYTPVLVSPVERDGNCLYSSLLKIALHRALAPPNRQTLRARVAERLQTEDVRIAITAILLSGDLSGVGPLLREQLAAAVPDRKPSKSKSKVSAFGEEADGNPAKPKSRAETPWTLSLLFLAYAKSQETDQTGNAEEVQAMEIDGHLVVASNSLTEVSLVGDALFGGKGKRKPTVLGNTLTRMYDTAKDTLAAMDGKKQAPYANIVQQVTKTLSAGLQVVSHASPDNSREWLEVAKPPQLHLLEVPAKSPWHDYHAEQKLLVALADLLNSNVVLKDDVVIWGAKAPCSICLKALEHFQEAFQKKLHKRQVIFSLAKGRNTEGRDLLELDASKLVAPK